MSWLLDFKHLIIKILGATTFAFFSVDKKD